MKSWEEIPVEKVLRIFSDKFLHGNLVGYIYIGWCGFAHRRESPEWSEGSCFGSHWVVIQFDGKIMGAQSGPA